MKRNWIILGIVLLLIGVTVYRHFAVPKTPALIPAGAASKTRFAAPAFTMKALDGQSYSVGGKRDKPLFLNFWASWCDPCKQEAPDLKAMYDKYKDRLDMYGVNVTIQDTQSEVEAFVKQYDFKFPVLLDPEGDAMNLYNLMAIPTSYLIDANGTIVETIYVTEPEQLEQKILNLINKPVDTDK